jgi:hypothetical protein
MSQRYLYYGTWDWIISEIEKHYHTVQSLYKPTIVGEIFPQTHLFFSQS